MSSFIVSKIELIKAAGLMCGYEEGKRDPHKYFIDNVRKELEHVYALNVVSVNELYGANELLDENSYDEVFEDYRKTGALIQREGYASGNGIIYQKVADVMDKREFRKRMFYFFNSVLYQIENDAAHRAASAWFYTCLSHLYDDDVRNVKGWWGKVELEAA